MTLRGVREFEDSEITNTALKELFPRADHAMLFLMRRQNVLNSAAAHQGICLGICTDAAWAGTRGSSFRASTWWRLVLETRQYRCVSALCNARYSRTRSLYAHYAMSSTDVVCASKRALRNMQPPTRPTRLSVTKRTYSTSSAVTSVPPYVPATPCPVLTQAVSTSLRARYAMSGTDVGYCATRCGAEGGSA
eukprot:3221149-Rhodomonas_salina.1